MNTNGKHLTATLIGSDKGGIGKSMIALILALAHDRADRPLKIMEIDHQAKLRSVLGDRVDLSLKAGADLAEVAKDRHRAASFYDPIYELWAADDSLTDLGANASTSLFQWMRECDVATLAAEDGIRFRFVAVTAPDDQAMKSAVSAIKDAMETLPAGSEILLVRNDIHGEAGFAPYKGTDPAEQLEAMQRDGKITVIDVPYCDSLLMEYGKAHRMSPLAVLDQADEVAKKMELGRVAASMQKRKLVNWLFNVQTAMAPMFLPAGEAAKVEAAAAATQKAAA